MIPSVDYFSFYDIPISFKVDAAALKKKFLLLSKKYHPDFHTQASEAEQAAVLEYSTLNTEAYKVLSDFDKRLHYVLTLKQVLGPEGDNKLPQDFLMEMMDINEAIMSLEFDFEAETYEKVKKDVEIFENQLLNSVSDIIENYSDTTAQPEDLEKMKIFYLKRKYLLRIQKNLSIFAPH